MRCKMQASTPLPLACKASANRHTPQGHCPAPIATGQHVSSQPHASHSSPHTHSVIRVFIKSEPIVLHFPSSTVKGRWGCRPRGDSRWHAALASSLTGLHEQASSGTALGNDNADTQAWVEGRVAAKPGFQQRQRCPLPRHNFHFQPHASPFRLGRAMELERWAPPHAQPCFIAQEEPEPQSLLASSTPACQCLCEPPGGKVGAGLQAVV